MPHQPQEPLSWAQRMQVGEVQDFLPGDDVEDADLGWNPEAHEHFFSGRGSSRRILRHGKRWSERKKVEGRGVRTGDSPFSSMLPFLKYVARERPAESGPGGIVSRCPCILPY
jgi:hypothetical protein